MERQREIDVVAVIHSGGDGGRIWHILENRDSGVPAYIRKQRGRGVYYFDFDAKAEGGVVYLCWGSKLINSNIIKKR